MNLSRFIVGGLGVARIATIVSVEGQGARSSPPPPSLPQTFFSGETPIRVVPVARGLSHPWSLAFLPDGSMLVTEREGRLRIIRNGVLDPTPVDGVPKVFARSEEHTSELQSQSNLVCRLLLEKKKKKKKKKKK